MKATTDSTPIIKEPLLPGYDPVGEPELILHIRKNDINQTLRTI